MNDKQTKRLFAEVRDIKKRLEDLESNVSVKVSIDGKEIKVADPFPRNKYPWSSFEKEFVNEKIDTLIKEISLKFGRDQSRVIGCLINNLNGRCPYGLNIGHDFVKSIRCESCKKMMDCAKEWQIICSNS
jgi:hypothetical protein